MIIKRSELIVALDQISLFAILSALVAVPIAIGLVESLVVIALLSGGLKFALVKKVRSPSFPFLVPLSVYLFAVLISMVHYDSFDLTSRGFLRTVKYLGVFWVARETINSKKRFLLALQFLYLGACLTVINVFYQWLTGWDLRHQYDTLFINNQYRLRGSFQHPNNLAAYLVSVLFICLYSKRRDKTFNILRWSFVVSLLLGLFLTGSRMPLFLMLALIIGISAVIARYRRMSLIFLGVVFVSGGAFCLLRPDYYTRLAQVLLGDLRVDYWRCALDLAIQKPLFGHGINTFTRVISKHPRMLVHSFRRFVYAHNFALQMLVETGLIGLGAFLWYLRNLFVESLRLMRESNNDPYFKEAVFAISLALAFFLLHSLVDNNLQSLQLNTFFWILCGSIAGVISTHKSVASRKV